jgi:hypothetical protein
MAEEEGEAMRNLFSTDVPVELPFHGDRLTDMPFVPRHTSVQRPAPRQFDYGDMMRAYDEVHERVTPRAPWPVWWNQLPLPVGADTMRTVRSERAWDELRVVLQALGTHHWNWLCSAKVVCTQSYLVPHGLNRLAQSWTWARASDRLDLVQYTTFTDNAAHYIFNDARDPRINTNILTETLRHRVLVERWTALIERHWEEMCPHCARSFAPHDLTTHLAARSRPVEVEEFSATHVIPSGNEDTYDNVIYFHEPGPLLLRRADDHSIAGPVPHHAGPVILPPLPPPNRFVTDAVQRFRDSPTDLAMEFRARAHTRGITRRQFRHQGERVLMDELMMPSLRGFGMVLAIDYSRAGLRRATQSLNTDADSAVIFPRHPAPPRPTRGNHHWMVYWHPEPDPEAHYYRIPDPALFMARLRAYLARGKDAVRRTFTMTITDN